MVADMAAGKRKKYGRHGVGHGGRQKNHSKYPTCVSSIALRVKFFTPDQLNRNQEFLPLVSPGGEVGSFWTTQMRR